MNEIGTNMRKRRRRSAAATAAWAPGFFSELNDVDMAIVDMSSEGGSSLRRASSLSTSSTETEFDRHRNSDENWQIGDSDRLVECPFRRSPSTSSSLSSSVGSGNYALHSDVDVMESDSDGYESNEYFECECGIQDGEVECGGVQEEVESFTTPADVGRWIRESRPMFIRVSQVQELVDRVERDEVTPTQLFEMAVGNGGAGDHDALRRLFHVTEHVGYSLQTRIPPSVVWRNLIIAKMNRIHGERTRMVTAMVTE